MERSDVESTRVVGKKKYKDKDGREFTYKLAWQEEEGKWCTALGDDWTISSSVLLFSGSHGVIVLSPNIRYIVK